jgi:hypothetical protein
MAAGSSLAAVAMAAVRQRTGAALRLQETSPRKAGGRSARAASRISAAGAGALRGGAAATCRCAGAR